MTGSRLRYATTGGVFTVAFIALGLLVHGRPLPVDRAIAAGLRDRWREPLGRIAGVLTDVLGPALPIVFGGVLVLLMLLCWWRGNRARAGLLLRVAVVLGLCRLTSVVSKPLFDRLRPRPYPGFSYPSGHVVSVLSAGVAATVLCLWLAPRLVRWIVALTVAATALAACCRIVLGVHWLTDTIGSVLIVLGVGLLSSTGLGLLPARREPLPRTESTA